MIRDNLHLKAPGNWINDPNGFIYYKGEYHLFYQYFPYGTRWGTMHWGHAVSKDLVHWEHLGIAVFPTKLMTEMVFFPGAPWRLTENCIFTIRQCGIWNLTRRISTVPGMTAMRLPRP